MPQLTQRRERESKCKGNLEPGICNLQRQTSIEYLTSKNLGNTFTKQVATLFSWLAAFSVSMPSASQFCFDFIKTRRLFHFAIISSEELALHRNPTDFLASFYLGQLRARFWKGSLFPLHVYVAPEQVSDQNALRS